MIVADTNLLIYLFIHGQRTSQAEAVVRKDPAWAAPLVWRSEFRNMLIGLVRQGDVPFPNILSMVEEAERWMAGREYTVVSARVLTLANESGCSAYGCSAYDCEFVSLAIELDVPLVTGDRQLLRAFPRVALTRKPIFPPNRS